MSVTRAGHLHRIVAAALKAAALIVFTVALAAVGDHRSEPPTAVLGEVEVVGANTEAVVATDSSVQIIDALCVSNKATPDMC